MLIIYIGLCLSALILFSYIIIFSKHTAEYTHLTEGEKAIYSELARKFNGKSSRILFFYFDYNCESCQNKIENLQITSPDNREQLLLFISANDSLKSITYLHKHLKRNQNFSYYYDKDFRIRNNLKIFSVPTLLEIDRKNNRKKHVSSF